MLPDQSFEQLRDAIKPIADPFFEMVGLTYQICEYSDELLKQFKEDKLTTADEGPVNCALFLTHDWYWKGGWYICDVVFSNTEYSFD